MSEELNSTSTRAERLINVPTKGLNTVAMVLLVFMMLFVAIDVIGRYFLNRPFKGSSDLIELMMGVVVFFSLAYCTQQRGDARVDVLYAKLPVRIKAYLDSITFSAGLLVYILITWRLSVRAIGYLREPATSPATDLLHIPYWPFIFLAALGSLLLCIQLMIHILRSLSSAR